MRGPHLGFATDNLKLLLEAADAELAETQERAGAAEEDTEEAYWVKHRLVRLLGVTAGMQTAGSTYG